jgi:hypothetical protein
VQIRRGANAADVELGDIAGDALKRLGPSPTIARARALASAAENTYLEDVDRARELAAEALQIARALDDDETLGHTLLSYVTSGRSPWNGELRLDGADELIAIGRRTRQSIFTIAGLAARAWHARERGDLLGCDHAIREIESIVGDRPFMKAFTVSLIQLRSGRACLGGDLAAAEAIAEELRDLHGADYDPTEHYAPAILLIRHAQGRIGELVEILEFAVSQPGVGDSYRAGLACAYAHAGREEEARTILRAYQDDGFASVPRNIAWLVAMVVLAETAELLGEQDCASALADELHPFSGWIADIGEGVLAPVDLALAQVALAAGDNQQAYALATKATAASRERKTPVFLGRELLRLAVAQQRLGRQGKHIDRLVDEALAIAERTGAQLIRQEAKRYDLV